MSTEPGAYQADDPHASFDVCLRTSRLTAHGSIGALRASKQCAAPGGSPACRFVMTVPSYRARVGHAFRYAIVTRRPTYRRYRYWDTRGVAASETPPDDDALPADWYFKENAIDRCSLALAFTRASLLADASRRLAGLGTSFWWRVAGELVPAPPLIPQGLE